jgi:hypothetical protein
LSLALIYLRRDLYFVEAKAEDEIIIVSQKLRMIPGNIQYISMSNQDRYEACMVLSGVGDALGYKNGHWDYLQRNGNPQTIG